MKIPLFALTALLPLLLFVSCTKQDAATGAADAPHATVLLGDGTSVSGTVASSTPSQITLNVDGGGSRTIPMSQVKSVNYNEAAPATDAIQTQIFEVPSGAKISVRNDETIDSAKAAEGHTYAGEVTNDVRDASGAVVIPHGANAQIVIKSASKGGRFHGASDLIVDLQSVSVGGQQYLLNTTDIAEKGRDGVGANKRTGEFVGAGAAAGALIGALAGHGKGAIIGAGAGAGSGALAEVLTKGKSIRIPAETLMTFRLDQPLSVVQQR